MPFAFFLPELLVWNVPLFLCLAVIAIIYCYFYRKTPAAKRTDKKPLLFLASLCLLFLLTGSPLASLSHLSFSLHMIQMSLLFFIVPPLLLAGIPVHFFKKIKSMPLLKKFTFPSKLALLLFALFFLLYHLPPVLSAITQHTALQHGYTLLLLLLACSMWWPIISPDPSQRLSKEPLRRYLWMSVSVLMPACLLFILLAIIDGTSNPYLSQMTAALCLPEQAGTLSLLPPPFNTRWDQITAGTLMLILHKAAIMLSLRLGNA
ncbi:cytochrome c oxidase assembly protein [Virgibacillus xinjiangensis]|uniref:Cytochrome c oxidase assembly protein n=1 Tax=Virgibacillus xinjiangensis TaxID=393090 RepID=A0ABV7CXA0_9BACI